MINWEISSRNWVIAKISEKTACEAAREERPAQNMGLILEKRHLGMCMIRSILARET